MAVMAGAATPAAGGVLGSLGARSVNDVLRSAHGEPSRQTRSLPSISPRTTATRGSSTRLLPPDGVRVTLRKKGGLQSGKCYKPARIDRIAGVISKKNERLRLRINVFSPSRDCITQRIVPFRPGVELS